LHLRIDNADRRLTPYGRKVGLIPDQAWANYLAKQERLDRMKQVLEGTRLTAEMVPTIQVAYVEAGVLTRLAERSSANRTQQAAQPDADRESTVELSAAIGQTLAQLLKRPEI
jgi:tRNA uridine 5-carboxymethylaminomethyl modification enzyme